MRALPPLVAACVCEEVNPMARVCQITGKRPTSGNNVSHANNKTKRRFLPNLHTHRFWVESENRWVRLRVSSHGMRIIDKRGIDTKKTKQQDHNNKDKQKKEPTPCVKRSNSFPAPTLGTSTPRSKTSVFCLSCLCCCFLSRSCASIFFFLL